MNCYVNYDFCNIKNITYNFDWILKYYLYKSIENSKI